MGSVLSVGSARLEDRVARLKSSKRKRTVTVRPILSPGSESASDPIDQPGKDGFEFFERPNPATEGALGADAPPSSSDDHPARIAVVGKGMELVPRRRTEQVDESPGVDLS